MVLLDTNIGHDQGRESTLGRDGRTVQAAGWNLSMIVALLIKWKPPRERLHPRDSHDLSRSEIRASGLMSKASRKLGQAGGVLVVLGAVISHPVQFAVASPRREVKRVTGNRQFRQPINL